MSAQPIGGYGSQLPSIIHNGGIWEGPRRKPCPDCGGRQLPPWIKDEIPRIVIPTPEQIEKQREAWAKLIEFLKNGGIGGAIGAAQKGVEAGEKLSVAA